MSLEPTYSATAGQLAFAADVIRPKVLALLREDESLKTGEIVEQGEALAWSLACTVLDAAMFAASPRKLAEVMSIRDILRESLNATGRS